MSKIFDPLQRAKEERLRSSSFPFVFSTESISSAKKGNMTPPSDSMLACRKPSAGLADTARWELVKLVQRLFCAPDLKAPRLVVLSGLEAKNQSGWVAACASEIL